MSTTPRAIKPLVGAGARLLTHQWLLPRSSRGMTPARFELFITRRLTPSSSSSICLQCRANSTFNRHQRLNFSSSSSKPPDNGSSHTIAKDNNPQNADSPARKSASTTTATTTTSPPDPDPSLPSTQNSQRSPLVHSLSTFMDRMQTTLFTASQRINDLTGYSGIETLKEQISSLESSLSAAQSLLRRRRAEYKATVSSRSATQREVTALLARQKTWTPADFERFTGLYRQDHELEADVSARAAELEEAERTAESLNQRLSAGMLSRYHEEQIWSDKIRRMSTWGTWGLMGVNVLLFLLFQFGAEPWRRRRLVRGFEEKVREAIAEDRERGIRAFTGGESAAEPVNVDALPSEQQTGMDVPITPIIEEKELSPPRLESERISTTTPIETPAEEDERRSPIASPTTSWRETLTDPQKWRAAVSDLTSERRVGMRMRDVSLVALEGAVAGAAVAGTVAVFLLR